MHILESSSLVKENLIENRISTLNYLNITDAFILSTNIETDTYNTKRNATTITKTQIKVTLTVFTILSLIMLIVAIFRFKNACRSKESDNLQSEIIRQRAQQYSEPSSRRGSVGYYTRRYSIRLDDQLNVAVPSKRLSVPACDQPSKSAAAVVISSTPVNATDVVHCHHVTSSCHTSNISNQQISIISTSSADIKPTINKSDPHIRICQCDDQTPLLTSDISSNNKNPLNNKRRKHSLNTYLPNLRPSNSHPVCSSLASTNTSNDNPEKDNDADIKHHRRISYSSALRRSSYAKQPRSFCSTVDSSTTNKTISPTTHPSDANGTFQAITKPIDIKPKQPILTSFEDDSSLIYQKKFINKIERLRFIDDSASSTTTITSPIQSTENINTRPILNELISNIINQFDTNINNNNNNNNKTYFSNDEDNDLNEIIDQLNSDLLTNGSYSDLNILNQSMSSTKAVQDRKVNRPVNDRSLQTKDVLSTCQEHENHQSKSANISHSISSYPLSKPRCQNEANGHSRSMDFRTVLNKRDLVLPIAPISTFNDLSSLASSTTTLTSVRSLTSFEFDDNVKPSGVLVDDDFLPMSSPVDEHFWNFTLNNGYSTNNTECFPNVGSSPDVEIKHFDLQQLNNLSETSCDEDDNDTSRPETYSIHEYKIKELQKPLIITKSASPIQKLFDESLANKSSSDPSSDLTEQLINDGNQIPSSIDLSNENGLSISDNDDDDDDDDDDDEIHESSIHDLSDGEESIDNDEIDLNQEFDLSQTTRETCTTQDGDTSSTIMSTPIISNRTQPISIMKIAQNKSNDNVDDQQHILKPKVRFNLDPQYEREREWNKVNKLLGNSVEWTDEFEV